VVKAAARLFVRAVLNFELVFWDFAPQAGLIPKSFPGKLPSQLDSPIKEASQNKRH
jgi:hypothetical protein